MAATSTDYAPWYVIPADQKWVTRSVVADILIRTIRTLDLKYPELSEPQKKDLVEARIRLESE